jgi:hypothetical protein
MKFKIWHANNPTFGFGEQPKFPEEYTKVSLVEADSVADTFRITNHIDSDWRMNDEVIESYKDRVRSTSIGDIVEDEDDDFYLCASVGWEKMDVDENCSRCKGEEDAPDYCTCGNGFSSLEGQAL